MIDRYQCIKNIQELFDETSAAILSANQISCVNYHRFSIQFFFLTALSAILVLGVCDVSLPRSRF